MTVVVALVLLELILVAYIFLRVRRFRVTRSPGVRALILTSSSLLVGMLSVTEPVEALIRGPDGQTVWLPTMLKHLSILGCGAGIMLMGSSERSPPTWIRERMVWTVLGLASLVVVVTTVAAGQAGHTTSIGYVEWSHSVPLLSVSMLVTYLGGLLACIGFIVFAWPPSVRTPALRGLTLCAAGCACLALWCVLRTQFVVTMFLFGEGIELAVTARLSLVGLMLITFGLLWSAVEPSVRAYVSWRRFQALHEKVTAIVPEVVTAVDHRQGMERVVMIRAVELLDGLHQIADVSGGDPGLSMPPTDVQEVSPISVADELGRQYAKEGSL